MNIIIRMFARLWDITGGLIYLVWTHKQYAIVSLTWCDMCDDYYDMEYELYEDLPPCPKCGSHETRSRHCDAWPCDDGYCDEYEDDPINFSPGEMFTLCRECWGTGVQRWCTKCGCDISFWSHKTRVKDSSG